MKKLLLLSLLAAMVAESAGCSSSSCGSSRSWFSWWNRGDSCRTCTGGNVISEDTYPGALGSPIFNNVPAAPRGSSILPGPIGISPTN